jgi:hypothetical protein
MTHKQDESAKSATATTPAFGRSSNGIAIPGRLSEADDDGQDKHKPLDLPISFTSKIPLLPRRTED